MKLLPTVRSEPDPRKLKTETNSEQKVQSSNNGPFLKSELLFFGNFNKILIYYHSACDLALEALFIKVVREWAVTPVYYVLGDLLHLIPKSVYENNISF